MSEAAPDLLTPADVGPDQRPARAHPPARPRDERHFADPERFYPARVDNRHLGFSIGPHDRVGAALGRIEAQIAVGTLLRRFPGLQLAGAAPRLDNATIRGFASLPIAPGGEA